MIRSNCEQCGIEIIRNGNKAGRFCSLTCKAEWQRTQKPVDEQWLREKYLIDGLSTYKIAKIVNRNPKQIYQWLKGYGIPTRPRGENLKGEDNYMLQGNENPFRGKKHTDETKENLRKIARRQKPYLRGSNNGMYGRTGAKNPHYIDGSSPERQSVYASAKWKATARKVKKRDYYKCVRCGERPPGHRGLHLHHIKPWAGNEEVRYDLDNIICLCRGCHEWVHSRANVHSDYLE